ncbi:MAG: 2-amino-4-hydroxy-6-hydroxymethyldihydropteridine diphosphokinase [Armatimonadota bacterium]
MPRAFIGVGSNIDPENNIMQAVGMLAAKTCVTAISTFYLNPAEERPDQPDFINGVVEIVTDLPPDELKQSLLWIEEQLGRSRTADKYASRTIDLDILVYDDQIINPASHSEIRAFEAIPLRELAPELVIPHFTECNMQPLMEYTRLLRADLAQS